FPHEAGKFLSCGHTIEGGGATAGAGTPLTDIALLPSTSLPERSQSFPHRLGRHVHLWAIWPLHRRETKYAVRKGTQALEERLLAAGVRDVVDPDRPCVVPRPRIGRTRRRPAP